MLNSKRFKKLITVLLVINLIYANFSMAISGMVSYALDEGENLQQNSHQVEVNEEKKALEIQLTEFCKDNMVNQETKYQEKLNLNFDYDENFNEVIINDVNTVISDAKASEDVKQEGNEIRTLYKTTKLEKNELVKTIGTEGRLEIIYDSEKLGEEEQTFSTGDDDNLIILPEENIDENNIGKVFAQEGKVIIDAETLADEEGYITIVYPERTYSLDITILTNTTQINQLQIVNNKVIEKVENVENLNQIQVTKQIMVKGENELLNTLEMREMPINYSKTFAELGIDQTQISTSIENKVNFTITMHTDKEIYNLYKNPYFVIELPSKVKSININTLVMLNNQYFSIKQIEEKRLENGNNAIVLELEGEQTEYTKSLEENMQIVIEATLSTEKLMPTEQSQVRLYYKNEIAKTYETTENQENGLSIVDMELISNKEVIVESKAIAGEQIISSPKETYNTINI